MLVDAAAHWVSSRDLMVLLLVLLLTRLITLVDQPGKLEVHRCMLNAPTPIRPCPPADAHSS